MRACEARSVAAESRSAHHRVGAGLSAMPVEPENTNLLGRSLAELRELLAPLGEPAYRADQIYHALYAERRFNFADMTNLPAALRARLAGKFEIAMPGVAQRYRSSDGSVRYLLSSTAPADTPQNSASLAPARIETVFMPAEGRQT